MNIEYWLRLASEGVGVIQAVVWLLLGIGVFSYFRRPLRDFLQQATQVKVGVGPGGVGIEMTRVVAEASASLGAAEGYRQADVNKADGLSPKSTQDIVGTVFQALESQGSTHFDGARILWVDDYPSNNAYERRAFESLGISIDTALSTEEALERLRRHTGYSAIISDMGRPPDQEAGYTLLRAVRDMGLQTPFFIYAGSNRPEYKARARSEGAQGSTNDPIELFSLVTEALAKPSVKREASVRAEKRLRS